MYRIRRYIEHKQDVFIGYFVKRMVQKSKLEFGLNLNEERECKIIVSMKTYNKRYRTIEPTLKSLLIQTIKPDKIIVWLDEEKPENFITNEMREYEKYGVEYRYTDKNLRSHGKYYYVMKEYPDDIIITVDDDVIYSKNLLASLINMHRKFPDAVCARRVHLMTFINGKLEKYNDWEYEYRKMRTPSYLLLAIGVGGVLYPPRVLPLEAFDVDNIKKYCYMADDIWLKVMEIKNNIKVVWVPNRLVHPPVTELSQECSLSAVNVIKEQNDEYIQRLRERYPEVFAVIEMIE